MANALLDVVAMALSVLVLSRLAGRAAVVMLASNPVRGLVTVAGASVMVAVTAVPLELTVINVFPEASVVIATYVAVGPFPSTDDKPGVSVRTADPRVI